MNDIFPLKGKKKPIHIPIGQPVELMVIAVMKTAMRCKVLKTGEPVTLRKVRWEVPGEIITVLPSKVWRFKNTDYIAGDVTEKRIDIPALRLTPLKLEEFGEWDPDEHVEVIPEYEPHKKYFLPIVAYGKRMEYKMEQVIPFEDPENSDTEPILQAVDAHDAGDNETAYRIMTEILTADFRCIDAHAHMGNWSFDTYYTPGVEEALRHYQVGKEVAELSLGTNFHGMLPWGPVDNRPYLRCLHGYGLCLWRLGKEKEAYDVFEWMLWLNPSDNQGMRMLLEDIDSGRKWEDRAEMEGR